jgi:hypothetical protein
VSKYIYKMFTMLKAMADVNNAKEGILTSFLAGADGHEAIASKLIEVGAKS